MRKLIGVIMLMIACQAAIAQQCPSVKELKKHHLHGFQAYDIDDGNLLTKKRLNTFIRGVDQFILAEWRDTLDHYGAIHCYYRDKEGSEMETYLVKNNLKPHNSKRRWYQVSGSMHCAAGMLECEFTNSLPAKKQFAKK